MKILTGILLIPTILTHLNITHLHSENLILSGSTLYFLILILLSLHITAGLRDILIEAEVQRSATYLVLLLIFLALLLPLNSSGNTLESFVNSTPENGNCIKKPEWMIYNHGYLLKKWRDEVVRDGNRFLPEYGEKGFTTCYSCHSYRDFCSSCHQKIGISPDCFSCHIAQENLEKYREGGGWYGS
jgi:succinate dehydrogenase hydrophobic anchor subunit